jgi:hypothetical protein
VRFEPQIEDPLELGYRCPPYPKPVNLVEKLYGEFLVKHRAVLP